MHAFCASQNRTCVILREFHEQIENYVQISLCHRELTVFISVIHLISDHNIAE